MKTLHVVVPDNVLPTDGGKTDDGFVKSGAKVIDVAMSKIGRHIGKKGTTNKTMSTIFMPPDPVAPPVPRIGAQKLHTDPFAPDRVVTISPAKKKIQTPRHEAPDRRIFKHVEITEEQKKAQARQEKISMGPFIAVAGQMITGGKRIHPEKNQETDFDENKWWKSRFGSVPKPVSTAKVPISRVFDDQGVPSNKEEPVHRAGKRISYPRPTLEGVFSPLENKEPRKPVDPAPFATELNHYYVPHRSKKHIAAPTVDDDKKEFQGHKKKLLGPSSAGSHHPYIHTPAESVQQPNRAAASYKGLELPFATSRSPSQQLMIC